MANDWNKNERFAFSSYYVNGTKLASNENLTKTMMFFKNNWRYMVLASAPKKPFKILNFAANATINTTMFNMSSKCPQLYIVPSTNNKTGAIATQVTLLVAGALAMLF